MSVTTPLRLARVLALLSVVGATTVLAPNADAQRQDTVPAYTLSIGGVDVLYAVAASITGVPVTPRSNLARATRITFTGLTFPSGSPNDGDLWDDADLWDCGPEEEETCIGLVKSSLFGVTSCISMYGPVVSIEESTRGDRPPTTYVVDYDAIEHIDCNQED